eukprot:6193570-Prymnesium_polylepis.1
MMMSRRHSVMSSIRKKRTRVFEAGGLDRGTHLGPRRSSSAFWARLKVGQGTSSCGRPQGGVSALKYKERGCDALAAARTRANPCGVASRCRRPDERGCHVKRIRTA